MAVALVWTVDGIRVPKVAKPPQKRPQRNTAVSRAILEAHAAAYDPTDPDLTPFGVSLTPAQTEQCRQWATARRDRWTHLNGGNPR